MAQVKFVNTAKYKGINYPAHTPFEVEDADVESLVKDGAIVIVAPKAVETSDKSFDAMKVDELRAYAESNNIDIGKAQKKADIIAAIKAAECPEE